VWVRKCVRRGAAIRSALRLIEDDFVFGTAFLVIFMILTGLMHR